MRKIIIWVVWCFSILLVVFVASFYFMGIMAEHRFKQVVETFSTLTRQDVKIVNYQRHWFSSGNDFAILP